MCWIQAWTGKVFYPFNPCIEDIDIKDIAHSLSLICRYNGHCREFYCVMPDTHILTANLEWVKASKLQLGQHLIGFDENVPKIHPNNRNRRKLRDSIVLHNGI